MDVPNVIASASGVLALVAIFVSLAVARSQSNLSRREHVLAVASDLLSEIREPEARRQINYIRQQLQGAAPMNADGTWSLPPDVYETVRPTMTYFNTVGLLVAHGNVSAEIVSSVMGRSILETWTELAPYVYAERARRGNDSYYYGYYEHIAALVVQLNPEELDRTLSLRRLPPSASPTQRTPPV